jgi:hypothetical protein
VLKLIWKAQGTRCKGVYCRHIPQDRFCQRVLVNFVFHGTLLVLWPAEELSASRQATLHKDGLMRNWAPRRDDIFGKWDQSATILYLVARQRWVVLHASTDFLPGKILRYSLNRRLDLVQKGTLLGQLMPWLHVYPCVYPDINMCSIFWNGVWTSRHSRLFNPYN